MNNLGNSFIHYDYQSRQLNGKMGEKIVIKYVSSFITHSTHAQESKEHTATKLSSDQINKETEKWPSARQMRVNQGLAMMIQTTPSKLQSYTSYKFLCVAGQTQYIYYVMVNWSAGGGDVESS